MDYDPVDDDKLMYWIIEKNNLRDKVKEGKEAIFGPFPIRRKTYCVLYHPLSQTWELVEPIDTSAIDYLERRDRVVVLANEHRGTMRRAEFVQLLIAAAIETGITARQDILDTVELAANLEAVILSRDTEADYESIPSAFDEAYIKRVLGKHTGKLPHQHLWWVDTAKNYRLH